MVVLMLTYRFIRFVHLPENLNQFNSVLVHYLLRANLFIKMKDLKMTVFSQLYKLIN